MFVTDVKLDGKDAKIWAVRQATMFHYRIAAGRWYTPAEAGPARHVAVVERDIARSHRNPARSTHPRPDRLRRRPASA